MKTPIAPTAAILLAVHAGVAHGQDLRQAEERVYAEAGFSRGADVCFRTVEAGGDAEAGGAVQAIALMGRNLRANPTGPEWMLVLSMQVALRDRSESLLMHGACYPSRPGDAPSLPLRCLFSWASGMPMQPLELMPEEEGVLRMTAAHDWRIVAEAQNADGGFASPPAADQNLLLVSRHVSECSFDETVWTAQGASDAIWAYIQ